MQQLEKKKNNCKIATKDSNSRLGTPTLLDPSSRSSAVVIFYDLQFARFGGVCVYKPQVEIGNSICREPETDGADFAHTTNMSRAFICFSVLLCAGSSVYARPHNLLRRPPVLLRNLRGGGEAREQTGIHAPADTGHPISERTREPIHCMFSVTCVRSLAGLTYLALRLEPGQDIYEQLRIAAGPRSLFVLSCVGSVTSVGLRFIRAYFVVVHAI